MSLFIFFLALFVTVLSILILYFFYWRLQKNIPQSETLFTDALVSIINGDNKKAIILLKQVVKQDTNHIKAYLQLGNLLRNDYTEQAIKIHQSLTIRPQLSSEIKVEIHKALAKDYIEIGYVKNAAKEAKEILSLEKRNLWAIEFLINISESEQDWEEAAIWSRNL